MISASPKRISMRSLQTKNMLVNNNLIQDQFKVIYIQYVHYGILIWINTKKKISICMNSRLYVYYIIIIIHGILYDNDYS